jgi:hypothetical protein
VNGAEVHNTQQLEELGLRLPQDEVPARGGVSVVAVPKEDWRRFFEYAALERETGVSRASTTYSAVEVRVPPRWVADRHL